jgi:hypothetical protein
MLKIEPVQRIGLRQNNKGQPSNNGALAHMCWMPVVAQLYKNLCLYTTTLQKQHRAARAPTPLTFIPLYLRI